MNDPRDVTVSADPFMVTGIRDHRIAYRLHAASDCGYGYTDYASRFAYHDAHYDPDGEIRPLDDYAWPGGYPILYVSEDGDTFCGRHAWSVIVREDVPMSRDVYWEGPDLWCEEGSHAIPSAYGDPDAADDQEATA